MHRVPVFREVFGRAWHALSPPRTGKLIGIPLGIPQSWKPRLSNFQEIGGISHAVASPGSDVASPGSDVAAGSEDLIDGGESAAAAPSRTKSKGQASPLAASGSSSGSEGGPAANAPLLTAREAEDAAAASTAGAQPIPAAAPALSAEAPGLQPYSGRMLILDAMAVLYRAHHASFGPSGRLTNSRGEDTSGERRRAAQLLAGHSL
jgi:hypothetical protein